MIDVTYDVKVCAQFSYLAEQTARGFLRQKSGVHAGSQPSISSSCEEG